VRFPEAIPVRSAYSLPQALVGLKEWTKPDVIFKRNILLGLDNNQAFELARNIRKQLVDIYKLLYPLLLLNLYFRLKDLKNKQNKQYL
jgi:hypothetical protein